MSLECGIYKPNYQIDSETMETDDLIVPVSPRIKLFIFLNIINHSIGNLTFPDDLLPLSLTSQEIILATPIYIKSRYHQNYHFFDKTMYFFHKLIIHFNTTNSI